MTRVVKKSKKPRVVDAAFEKDYRAKAAAREAGGQSKNANGRENEKSEQDLKAERLAAALRENLLKRKEQARARDLDNSRKEGGEPSGK